MSVRFYMGQPEVIHLEQQDRNSVSGRHGGSQKPTSHKRLSVIVANARHVRLRGIVSDLEYGVETSRNEALTPSAISVG